MTTPQMQQAFTKDNGDLMAAAGQYVVAQSQEKTAETNYKDIILKKLDACQTADQILMYLQMYVFQNSLPPSDPHSDDCLFGIFGDQVGVQGKGLQVNSLLTQVHNDIQKMVDSGSDDMTVVSNVQADLDTILNELHVANGASGDLASAMDPTALGNMESSDFLLRQQFYNPNDSTGYTDSDGKFVAYNPTWDGTSSPTADSFHFTVGGTAGSSYYLQTFSEMETDMKGTGDDKFATEGYKALTDNLNADTSMTQTVNSEINEKINQLTNFIKTLLGFYENGLLQPGMKLANVAIQNQTKGS
jgi:hypothetical protein